MYLDRGALQLLRACLAVAFRAPGHTLRALALALRCGRASSVGVIRHLIYLAEAAEVLRQCKAADIEHIHAHFGTNSAMVAMLVQALGGPGFSFTTHGPEEFDAPAAFSLGEKLKRCRFAVGVSRFGRSQLCRWLDLDHWHKVKVVHCGIEPVAFTDPDALPELPVRLVSIGRFAEQKGQAVLLDAMTRLRSEHPDIRLTLVGDGELRPALEAMIDAHDLRDTVDLSGWLDETQVMAQLRDAHLLVMPSFAEGLPVVIMEAMAAARPVIASRIAGIPELVTDAQTGWLVTPGDAQELANCIARAAGAGREKLSEMGVAGRERVFARHDIEGEARKLAAHFRNAIDG